MQKKHKKNKKDKKKDAHVSCIDDKRWSARSMSTASPSKYMSLYPNNHTTFQLGTGPYPTILEYKYILTHFLGF